MPEKQLPPFFKYRVFGLNIQSEIELPELIEAQFSIADVSIYLASNPMDLENPVDSGILYQAKENDLIFRLDTVGSFRIMNGESISVERLNNSCDSEIRLFLLGSAFGALLLQREIVALHSSSVAKNNEALIIGGMSGAGKSSIAATLVKRGYDLISDDITAIDVKKDKPEILPGIPHLKLWEDVLKHLDIEVNESSRIRPNLLKYRQVEEINYIESSVPVKCLILLKSKNSPGFVIQEKTGAEKLIVLNNNTFRYQFIKGLKKAEIQFLNLSMLANNIRIFELSRPLSPILLEDLADFLEEKLHQLFVR